MKKTLYIIMAAAVLFSGCKKTINKGAQDGPGILSLGGLAVDEAVIDLTKASAASGNYSIFIYDSQNNEVVRTIYSAVKNNDNKLSLPAGDYTFVTRSSEDEVPYAEFEQPVYGASKTFNIVSGEVTELGDITCSLLQTKVTVSYNDEFLSSVTGNGTATVEVTSGYPLKYSMNYASGAVTYERQAGYFAVPEGETTMVVSFQGSIDGKSGKMVKGFSNIKAREWHQITFVKKVNAEGNATLQISIDGFVEDLELVNMIDGEESTIADDPNAPTGDGGIELVSTCSFDINAPIIVPVAGNPFDLTMKAIVPNKVKKFTVEITSTNDAFVPAVQMINNGSNELDLVNPSTGAIDVFTTILPFPYGADVKSKDEILFDLSDAQAPLLGFPGTHTFVMKVTDEKGCKKDITLNLVVE